MSTLPAGSYYLGDPCYVIPHEKWNAFCAVLFTGSRTNYGLLEFEGRPLWVHRANGDGGYHDQDFREYSVDSGMLSAIPIELCTRPGWARLGHAAVFREPFECRRSSSSVRFGTVRIKIA